MDKNKIRREYIKLEMLLSFIMPLGMGVLGAFFIKHLGAIKPEVIIAFVKDAGSYTMLFYGVILTWLRSASKTNTTYIVLRSLFIPLTAIGFFNPYIWVVGIGVLNAVVAPVNAKWRRDRKANEARLGAHFVALLSDMTTNITTKASILGGILSMLLISLGDIGFQIALTMAIIIDGVAVYISYRLYRLSSL